MFGKKSPVIKSEPQIEVIGVTPIPKGKVTVNIRSPYDYSTTESKFAGPRTIVLYLDDGELKTQLFDGEWSLEQVKKWRKI